MLSIKITPLFLFLLLLFVLVISVLFGNYLISLEGFVSFQKTKSSNDRVLIPTYSKTATPIKLYDNLYFDDRNGNLIEIDSTTYVNSENVDSTGLSIATTKVIPRMDNTRPLSFTKQLDDKNNVISVDIEPSKTTAVSSSFTSYIYSSQSKNTDKYSVLYIPFDTDTYLHIIDNTSNTNIGSYYFSYQNKLNYFHGYTNSIVGIDKYITYTAPTNTSATDNYYDTTKNLYLLSPYVKFDIKNGNLIIQTQPDGATKSITVYSRDGSSKSFSRSGEISSAAPPPISSIDFIPFICNDLIGQNIVLYLPHQQDTIIALLGFSDSTLKSYNLNMLVRFNKDGVAPSSGQSNSAGKTVTNNNNAGPNNLPPNLPTTDSVASEYFKWYWYWKNNEKPPNVNYSDDYLLKTQIVPPVCPSCPACNSGACTNCGGKGGSGTLSYAGNSIVGGSGLQNIGNQGQVKGQNNNQNPTANYSTIGNGTFS